MHAEAVSVLLVEDNPMDVELTLRAFQKNRLANPIHVVRDGEEALDYIHRRGAYSGAAQAPVPGLVLLDIRLPKVDGLEVLRQMKSHPTYKLVPVVMLTTSSESVDVRQAYELGVNSYIVKPVAFEAFVECVQRIGLYWILTNVRPAVP